MQEIDRAISGNRTYRTALGRPLRGAWRPRSVAGMLLTARAAALPSAFLWLARPPARVVTSGSAGHRQSAASAEVVEGLLPALTLAVDCFVDFPFCLQPVVEIAAILSAASFVELVRPAGDPVQPRRLLA